MAKGWLRKLIFIFISLCTLTFETNQTANNKFVVTLQSYENLQYYGKIFVGSDKQELNVIFSTGSSFIWLPGFSCGNCTSSNKYNTQSLTYKNLTSYKTFNYTMGDVMGYLSSETFRVSQESGEITNIKFLLVDGVSSSISEKLKLDGVVGLGLDHMDQNLKYRSEAFEYSNLIYQFYKQGVIHSPRFSFYLSPGKQVESKLFVGDFSTGTAISPLYKQMNFCDSDKTLTQWGCELGWLEIKDHKISLNSNVLFDTGVSYLVIPITDFKQIKKDLIDSTNSECIFNENYQLLCKCSRPDQFPEMKIYVNGSPIILNPKDFIEYFPTLKYQCRFEMIVDMNNYLTWVLGNTVLKNILFSFDLTTRRIGFAQAPKDIEFYLNKHPILIEDIPEKESKLGYIFALLFIILIMFGIYKFANNENFIFSKKRRQDSFSYENLNDRKKVEALQNRFNENDNDYELYRGEKPNENPKKGEMKEMIEMTTK